MLGKPGMTPMIVPQARVDEKSEEIILQTEKWGPFTLTIFILGYVSQKLYHAQCAQINDVMEGGIATY